jgi:hypothetical protein
VNGYTATSDKFFCVASSAPSTAGLIASYPFNGNANDASGNNNNGTVNGAALTTDRFGIANSAYLFNGTSSFISVPNSASLQSPTIKLTMNAWINLNGYSLVGTSGYGPILTKSNSASSNFMYTFQIGSTPPKIYADVNNFSNFTSGDYSFCLNQWYMVTVVLDVNTSYFYVNGILIDTESFLTNIIPDALPMQIGRDVPGLTEVFNGKLDDIRIYNRALSACEVASLYTPGSTSPSISGFTPPSGAVGTAVIINGTNFDPSPTNNVVSFNGTVASVTAATAASITATVPSGATTGKISVTVNNCITVQTTSDFTVTAPLPTITTFTPASGPVGTTVTITGTNFSTTAASNTVAFNGTTSIVTASTATSITTTVPAGATTGAITVTVAGNTATSATNFTVTAPLPTITSFTPASGSVGTTVTITGTNFSTTPANNTVQFNGTTAFVTASTATSITTTVPTGAITGKISVTVGGNIATSTNDYTVTTSGGAVTIVAEALATSIGGTISKNLVSLITTLNNNLDLNSIIVTVQPPSGAVASVSNGLLTVDYTNIPFSGKESLTIRACDTDSNCTTQQFEIEVAGDIVVYNGISPNNDAQQLNEKLVLQYIDILPETQNNQVTIYSRWGDAVWEGTNYNNNSVVFTGKNNNGNELPSGTYFYKIQFTGNRKTETGYLVIKK